LHDEELRKTLTCADYYFGFVDEENGRYAFVVSMIEDSVMVEEICAAHLSTGDVK